MSKCTLRRGVSPVMACLNVRDCEWVGPRMSVRFKEGDFLQDVYISEGWTLLPLISCCTKYTCIENLMYLC